MAKTEELTRQEAEWVLGERGPLHGRVIRLSGMQARIALMAVVQGESLEEALAIAESFPREERN